MAVKGRPDVPTAIAQPSPRRDGWDWLGAAIRGVLPRTWAIRLFLLLLLASLSLRLAWLGSPDGALIFDETYYVNASRAIAGYASKEAYADAPRGFDPNVEHPPLAKLIVAASIALIGDNPYAWRLPSVVFGMLSIVLMFLIPKALTKDNQLSLIAATLFAFDNLVFVHSRIFTLDIFQLGFMLIGLYSYVRGYSTVAGVGFALSALCKVNGALGVGALIGYEFLRIWRSPEGHPASWQLAARRLVRVVISFGLIFFLMLGALDRVWVGYSSPFEHLGRIYQHGVALNRPDGPSGIESYPWQWLWNQRPIEYLRVEQQVKAGDEVLETRPLVLFVGAMNPYILGMLPVGLAYAVYTWYRRHPARQLVSLCLSWFVCTYAPFYLTTLFGKRISYIFYFLFTLPSLAWFVGLFLIISGLPRFVIFVYLLSVILAFFGHFPFKILP